MKKLKLYMAFIGGLVLLFAALYKYWLIPQNDEPLNFHHFEIAVGPLVLFLVGYLFLWAVMLLFMRILPKISQKILSIPTLNSYAKILPYAKPYWGRLLLAIGITVPIGAMDAVIAWSLKPFMDVVMIEKQNGWTSYIPLMIIVFSVLQALFTYFATYLNTWVGQKISLDLKRKLFDCLIHRDAPFFDKTDSGTVLLRFNRDAETACSGLLNSMRLFSTRFFSSVSLLIVLFYNSWKLALVASVVLFGALLPLTQVKKRLQKVVSLDVNAIALAMKHYNEAFSGNRIITAYNLFGYYKKRFNKTMNDLFGLRLQMTLKTGVISPFMHTISSFGIAFVIWYGSYLIVDKQITVGNFASFITSLVMLYNPLKSIGNNASGIVLALMAVDRVFSQLGLANSIQNRPAAKPLPHCSGNVAYNNVSFAYTKDKPVLKNINFRADAGKMIALVGNSGGGKSTISVLLPRFYDVNSGSVTIDGTDIRDIELNNLRDNIAIVFQDNFLFGGTIRENILLGRTDISEERLQEVIKAACLDEFIASLDKGLDTEIGERGVLVSGGQKQRIAIARAFIKNAPILILDEATSALDNKSEKIVQKAIDNLMKDRTVLVIAHRLSTIRNADCILVLNNGEIVERGNHEELLALDGEYAALYKAQLQ